MTKADLIQNLGTIARSGTKQFMEAITAGADLYMIGQFGVGSVVRSTQQSRAHTMKSGRCADSHDACCAMFPFFGVAVSLSFYAAFLVAERVQVHSKHNSDEQWVWESAAGGEFTVGRDPKYPRISRGTHIILWLKEDQKQAWTNQRSIRDTVKRHSEFIQYPIQLRVEKEVEEDTAATEAESAGTEEKSEEAGQVQDVTEEEEKKKQAGEKRKKTVEEWETLNTTKPSAPCNSQCAHSQLRTL